MQKPINRPWVIAHRGASAALRENTLPAFREAYARGADAVELDVRRTADDFLVIHHDAAVPDVGPIISMDREDLDEAAPWIPDLDDALAACAGMWVNVEIKNNPTDPDWDPDQRIARRVAEHLQRAGSIERFLVSSFNPESIRAAAEAVPELATGWLADQAVDSIQAVEMAAAAGHCSVHPHAGTLSGSAASEVAAAAHEAGLWVIVWTVDDRAEVVRLAEAGIDGIITNVPSVARSVLEDCDGDGG